MIELILAEKDAYRLIACAHANNSIIYQYKIQNGTNYVDGKKIDHYTDWKTQGIISLRVYDDDMADRALADALDFYRQAVGLKLWSTHSS